MKAIFYTNPMSFSSYTPIEIDSINGIYQNYNVSFDPSIYEYREVPRIYISGLFDYFRYSGMVNIFTNSPDGFGRALND